LLYAPARRALENNGIITLEKLSTFNEIEILRLYGMGKTAIPKLKIALADKGLTFKQDEK
jgi:DNA-directed RNA polymerase alpha subunit